MNFLELYNKLLRPDENLEILGQGCAANILLLPAFSIVMSPELKASLTRDTALVSAQTEMGGFRAVSRRHSGRVNYLTVDVHSEWVTVIQYFRLYLILK